MVTIGKGGLQSGSSLFKKKKQQPVAEQSSKAQPNEYRGQPASKKPNKTVEFLQPNKAGGGDVKVDGQLLTAKEYKAYTEQIGGGAAAENPNFTPKVAEMAGKYKTEREETAFNKDIEKQAQKELAIDQYKIENRTPAEEKLAADLGGIQAQGELGEVEQPAGLDVLDAGSILGGGTAGAGVGAGVGAALGSVIPGAGTAAGAAVGGAVGFIGGAATSYFASLKGERVQQVKVSNRNFKLADENINKLFNDANSGSFNPNYLQEAYELEWSKIYKARDELQLQQKALFGEKLSKSRDELAVVLNYIDRKPITDAKYNFAISNPSGQIYEIKPYEDTESDKGFFENLFG